MNRTFLKASILSLAAVFIFFACEEQTESPESLTVPGEVLDKLEALGYNSNEVVMLNQDEIIVEGDLLFNISQLDELSKGNDLATVEHYSTDNLVTGAPRTISIFVNMPQKYSDATDIAISRYNSENLNLTFQRVSTSSGADIVIRASPWYYYWFGILGSAGFPTAGGDPYNQILMTRAYYDNVSNINGLATTIAHEVGHCIGFRHTDYMDRSFSCGGSPSDEGASDVGANYIPGTPTGPDADSWMLACGSPEGDRPFTANDQTALDYVY